MTDHPRPETPSPTLERLEALACEMRSAVALGRQFSQFSVPVIDGQGLSEWAGQLETAVAALRHAEGGQEPCPRADCQFAKDAAWARIKALEEQVEKLAAPPDGPERLRALDHERTKKLARGFAQEWLRPNDPDHANEALVDTLQTAMLAFSACVLVREAPASPKETPSLPSPAQPLTCWWCHRTTPPPMVCNDAQTIAMCGVCAQKVADFLQPSPAQEPAETPRCSGCNQPMERVAFRCGACGTFRYTAALPDTETP